MLCTAAIADEVNSLIAVEEDSFVVLYRARILHLEIGAECVYSTCEPEEDALNLRAHSLIIYPCTPFITHYHSSIY